MLVGLEAALVRFIGQSQLGRWRGPAGGAVQHDLYPVHNAPGAGEAVPADVVLLGQIVTSSSNFCLHACEFEGKPAGGKDPATLKAIQDEVLKEFYDYTGCESLWG